MSIPTVRVIKDTNLAGLAELARRFQTREEVHVGVPEGAKEADGTPIALVAAAHEFGVPSKNIPERSFMRTGLRRALPHLRVLNLDSLKKVAEGIYSIHMALDRLGLVASSAVKREIVTGTFAPLQPATIKRKGSDKPLIDSASLYQAMTWAVVPAGS